MRWLPSQVRFSTKVLVPVLTTLLLLLGIIAWAVNSRLTSQFEADAQRSLTTAEAVFRNSQQIRTRNLLLRYRNLPNEPRYKAAFQTGHIPTLREELKDLAEEQGVDVVWFTSSKGQLLATAKHEPLLLTHGLEQASAPAVGQALAGQEVADTVRIGEKLFDLICLPVFGTSGELLGALSFGSEIGNSVAQEIRMLTGSHIVLFAGGRLVASSLPPGNDILPLMNSLKQTAAGPGQTRPSLSKALLNEEHFFCLTGRFECLNKDDQLGYLLLSSYEHSLLDLRSTRERLLVVGGFCILLASAGVWILVHRITQPLKELCASAEAVGKGDFSQRVEIPSRDEVGELAMVFNRMTDNLRASREQLEQTVHSLKTTQAQLVQSEKLSGIGEFVAGVAHELNNPLTAVMGFSELLARSETLPHQRRQIDFIYKSAGRCQKIVQSLLSFSRRHQPERKLSDINQLVEAAIEFLQYHLRTSNVEVVTCFDPNLPRTMVDPHQVQQVFLNIINNARQAIEPCRARGRVHITTALTAKGVQIRFQDNGPGIAPENLARVFDPFFTTKEVGKGTGLGLSLCYGIIKEHGGSIAVESQLAHGASFIIDLPLLKGEEAMAAPTVPPAAPAASPSEGAGRNVLVIDDEESVLQVVRDTLLSCGYKVDLACDAQTALERVRANNYDLALCDWKLPGSTGGQIYERLRVENPALSNRMIFITGDTMNEKAQAFFRQTQRTCLSKPFSIDEFRSAVSTALS